MKTIGLLGGMSWESTATYYKEINQAINLHLGGLHSAKICMVSLDFAEVEACQHKGDWQQAAKLLTTAAHQLEAAGADFILICTNTMHKVAKEVERSIQIPLLHIAQATGEKLIKDNMSKVALLGTRFTMEQTFYKDVLKETFNLDVVVPKGERAKQIHDVIYQELCLGKCLIKSKLVYLSIIEELIEEGAQAIILGCTEIGLLINQEDVAVPIYDTCLIHAEKAVELALHKAEKKRYLP
jgi:aspartate racemase